jgi:mitosis inhibitor protein kinase SWE1
MAPELLLPGGRAPPADVFSLGLTAFELAWDVVLPMEGAGWHDVREGRLPSPSPALARSDELLSVIAALLAPEPTARPSAAQILGHPHVATALAEADPTLAAHVAAARAASAAVAAASASGAPLARSAS